MNSIIEPTTSQLESVTIPPPLTIIYHDEHMVAIDKSSGLLVHRSPINRHETRFARQLPEAYAQQQADTHDLTVRSGYAPEANFHE